jgi:hypothetical protein
MKMTVVMESFMLSSIVRSFALGFFLSVACVPEAVNRQLDAATADVSGDATSDASATDCRADTYAQDVSGSDRIVVDGAFDDTTAAVDCNGIPGGSATEDPCGVCDADPSNDCQQDCNGEWGGAATEDHCGVCDEDPSNDCLQDCSGEWGGSATTDHCGVCDSNAANDCVQDCNGTWGGSTPGCWKDPGSNLGWETAPSSGASLLDWQSAVNHCQSATTAGYSDWFLPEVEQLRSIIRGCAATETGGTCTVVINGPSCPGCSGSVPSNGCFWPAALAGTCDMYWTATLAHSSFGYKWYIAFSNAYIDVMSTNMTLMARCARTVQ